MNILYAVQPFPTAYTSRIPGSIFLAGPTPRSYDVPSWRPEAIELLEEHGFDGTVFVPEAPAGGWHGVYDEQVHWEWEGLAKAACIMFWVPRELHMMPGFTTNVEFGLIAALRPDSVVLGAPNHAPKITYLRTMARDVTRLHKAFGAAETGHPPIPYTNGLKECVAVAKQIAERGHP